MFRPFTKFIRSSSQVHLRNISYFNKNHDFIWCDFEINKKNMKAISEIKFGFTTHGVEQLGDIVYAESFKEINDKICNNEPIGVVESVKASVDITPSVYGIITDINTHFFQLIEEVGGVGIDTIKQLDSYNDENGIFLYSIRLDEQAKKSSIQYIEQSYMDKNMYDTYLQDS